MKSIVILPLLASLTLLLTACGTTTGTSPKVGRSGFDDARTVRVAPHGSASGMSMIATGIGAEWTEARKDEVILIITVFNLYTAITRAELNIDGEKLALIPMA